MLYGLAWLFATRFRRMADRELETARPVTAARGSPTEVPATS
jgi:hypothetical protein